MHRKFKFTLNGKPLSSDDQILSGRELLQNGGHDPADEHVLIQLTNPGSTSVGIDEKVDLANRGKEVFHAFVSDRAFMFTIDGRGYEWGAGQISTSTLREISGAKKNEELVIEREGTADEVLLPDQNVDLDCAGTEHLVLKKRLFIFVDGEKFFPPSDVLTPVEIIKLATDLEPSQHYLVQMQANDQISYQGKPEQEINLTKGMKFLVIFDGAMTVSDVHRSLTGASAFTAGLEILGIEAKTLSSDKNFVYFDYDVPVGCFVGTKVKLGFQIPVDFPVTPPERTTYLALLTT